MAKTVADVQQDLAKAGLSGAGNVAQGPDGNIYFTDGPYAGKRISHGIGGPEISGDNGKTWTNLQDNVTHTSGVPTWQKFADAAITAGIVGPAIFGGSLAGGGGAAAGTSGGADAAAGGASAAGATGAGAAGAAGASGANTFGHLITSGLISAGTDLAKGLIQSNQASKATQAETGAAKAAAAGLNDYAQGGNQAYRQMLAKYGITLPAGATVPAAGAGGAPAMPQTGAPAVAGPSGPQFGGTMAPATPQPQGYSLADILGQQQVDPTAMNRSSFGGR